jgi:chemosensory pili system protein ChpA (sensor histidine kinase/response regulator)
VDEHLATVSSDQVTTLASSAIAQWERAQALIQLGRYENVPTELDMSEVTSQEPSWEEWEIPDIDDFDPDELSDLQEEVEQYDFSEFRDIDDFDPDKLSDLQEEVEQYDFSEFSEDTITLDEEESFDEKEEKTEQLEVEAEKTAVPEKKREETTVRVSVEQLTRLNTLFSRLILEREAVNSRLQQLEEFVNLSKSRTQQLEQANTQLRKWYDRLNWENVQVADYQSKQREGFDTLEMDRYSDLHVLFQEQMESIVQLQEVTSDLEVSSREMHQAMGELNFTTSDLQRGITRVQTRPFAETVRSFRRVVRDLSIQYDKPVGIDIQGENTLIDRSALEALSAPLNHLFRNAFDHGIEDRETRIARGKPERGTITLRASNQGNKSTITISDDGGGIDVEKIKARLGKLGATSEDLAQMSEQELLQSIFAPGFSTAERVTELSGRGVGMDVVRTNLDQIRGQIHVDTELGVGTTFTISFPLSLSIARAAIVEAGGVVFAVPAEVIKAFEQFDATEGSGEMTWNEETVPVFTLNQWSQFSRPVKSFEMEGKPTLDRPTTIIIDYYGKWQAFQVDRFWREQEVALRSVDSPLPLPPGITGSTVLGDGRPIPLVDPVQLLAWLQHPQEESKPGIDTTSNYDTLSTETILIIDDSIHVRRYLASALEKAGYQVEQAKDGREAVDKVFNGLPVQAAICDIEMPRLDGYGVLSEIKGHPKFKQLPIAMLTSRGNEKHRQLAMKLGASAYFSKPYNEQELLSTLASMTKQ